MISQFDSGGRLRHLLTLETLTREQIVDILDRAETLLRPPGQLPARGAGLAGRSVANLFF